MSRDVVGPHRRASSLYRFACLCACGQGVCFAAAIAVGVNLPNVPYERANAAIVFAYLAFLAGMLWLLRDTVRMGLEARAERDYLRMRPVP